MESAFDIIGSAWPLAFGFVTLVIVLAKMHGDIIVSAWPIAFGFVTLVIVLAKMHGDIIVLKEKVKSLFDLWNSRKDN